MSGEGQHLENLVRQVEELLLPKGFSVAGNSRVYNDENVQIAEFDIEVRGRLGSTDISWLIECRDRPGSGPAPGSWIEQLVGRRDRFRFSKVTAVSTTGFALGAEEYAAKAGIELRTVKEVTAEAVAGWLGIQRITWLTRVVRLDWVRLAVSDSEADKQCKSLSDKLRKGERNAPILRSTETGELVSLPAAFELALLSQPAFFEDLAPNGPAKPVNLLARYPDDKSHFVAETEFGPVRVLEILFRGEIAIKSREVPLESLKEYRRVEGQSHIAQVATFPVEEHQVAVELHNLAESGETYMVVRRRIPQ